MKTATIVLGLFSAAFALPSLRDDVSVSMFPTDPTDCIKEKCPNEFKACTDDSKCFPALQSCQTQCGTKQSCWQLCLAKKGDQNAINVAKCAAANDCLKSGPNHEVEVQVIPTDAIEYDVKVSKMSLAIITDPTDCIKEKCPNEYQACTNDSKCLPALQDCENKCGTKQSCWQFCLAGKGDSAAINVAKCAAANKCL